MLNRALSYLGIFFLYGLSLLPLNILYVFATGLYWILYHVFGYRKQVVRENLRNAFPDKSEVELLNIEKKFFKYLSAVIFEIIKMSTISRKELQKRFDYKDIGVINSYLENGQSVLVCSAHYGNWEWGTMAIGLALKGDIYPIYKPLSNKVFDKWFFHIRTRFGNRMTAMKQTFRALSESKDKVTAFCFGNDQAPPKNESHDWMQFLNQSTSFQLGIEKIAKKTNRPIFYIKVNVVKKGYYKVECVPLITDPSSWTIEEMTIAHTRFLENLINADPAYWLWSHKRWKHQPSIEQLDAKPL